MKLQDLASFNIDPKNFEMYLNKIKKQECMIVTTGEFSSGKSCFLNAFLNKKGFLPEDHAECTPVLVELYRGEETTMQVNYRDGREVTVVFNQENINRYMKHTEGYDPEILSIAIPVDSENLIKGVRIIDSPGTNTIIQQHLAINHYIIQRADIVLYTLNKVISETDIKSISNIMNYTKDIIFVLTHMDDCNRSSEEIQRLVEAVEKDLGLKLKIEDPVVLPVGSIEAYEEPELIEMIRATLNEYLNYYSKEDMKKKVKNQMAVLFEEEISKLNQETELYNRSLNKDKGEVLEKLNEITNQIQNLEAQQQARKFRIDEVAYEEVQLMEEEVKKSFELKSKKMIEEILEGDEITKEDLEAKFIKSEAELGRQIKGLVEDHSYSFLNKVYAKLNLSLKEILGGLEVNLLKEIKEPTIEILEGSHQNNLKIEEIEGLIKQSEANLMAIQEEIACSADEKETLKENIEAIKLNMNQSLMEFRELVATEPSYIEKSVEGGGGVGAMVGRVAGEIADIALILYNPQAGAKKVADTAKDAAKFASYITKSTKVVKQSAVKVNKVKKTIDAANHISKQLSKEEAKEAIDKVINLKKKGEEILREQQESNENRPHTLDAISKTLDLLSVGYWGEKAGRTIGEMIKPTRTLIEENEELKEQIQALDFEMRSLLTKKQSLEKAYKDEGQINKKIKLKREIEVSINRYKELKDTLLEKQNQVNQVELKTQIKNYYQREVEKLFQIEVVKGIETTKLIFESIVSKTKEQVELELQDVICQLYQTMENLSLEKDELAKLVEKNNNNLNQLQNYPQWIEEWVS